MSEVDGTGSLAFRDLAARIDVGLARGRDLLTAGEQRILARIVGLEGEAAALLARLQGRVHTAWSIDDPTLRCDQLPATLGELEALDLIDHLVPRRIRAQRTTAEQLRVWCRARGLPSSGSKAALVERVTHATDPFEGAWFRVLHKGLLARVERFAALRVHPDRSAPIVARLGFVRWVAYPLTRGPGLFPDRRSLLSWEALARDGHAPEVAKAGLSSGAGRGPGRLDLTRWLRGVVRGAAETLAEGGDPASAAAAYAWLVEVGERPAKVALRRARAEERSGRLDAAITVLRHAQGSARPSEGVAIVRTGRRLARALGTGFAPNRPLRTPRLRTIRLTAEAPNPAGRPRWATPDGPRTIEDAVSRQLAALGRTALHAEGGPWSTLAAALLADVYFSPVDRALPVPYLSGPLDLGTSAFRAARRAPIEALLQDLEAGLGGSLFAVADPRWRGLRVAGADWSYDAGLLYALATHLPPAALRRLVEVVVDEGPRATRGLPDLIVLPGPATRLPGALPERLAPGLLLAEIKGPGDTVRDDQAVWFDRLLGAEASVELWEVRPSVGVVPRPAAE